MEDNEFYIKVWKIIIIGIIGLVATIGGCSSYQTSKLTEMISNGVPATQAYCAISGITDRNVGICYEALKNKTNHHSE